MCNLVQLLHETLLPECRLKKYCDPCAFPVGHRVSAPEVLGSSELSCCSCTWTFDPNSNLQCLLWSIPDAVMIVLGLIFPCALSLCGKQFIQNIALYTISTISQCGYISKVSLLAIALTLSFTVLMHLFMAGTCSSPSVMFRFIPVPSSDCQIFSNYPSPSMFFKLNSLPLYVCTTCHLRLIKYTWIKPCKQTTIICPKMLW